jgi:hypothetical protein
MLAADTIDYLNNRYGIHFTYSAGLDIVEGYPATWPPAVTPSVSTPYIITLTHRDSRYPLIKIEVLPKSSMDKAEDAVKDCSTPYSTILEDDIEHLNINGVQVYRHITTCNAYLYYISHPDLPYEFVVSLWDRPRTPEDLRLLYDVLGSISFYK